MATQDFKGTINKLPREVICLNEVGGDMNAVLRFSDPDGKAGRMKKHGDNKFSELKTCQQLML